MSIKGKAAHAGVAPEKGISATLVGALGSGRGSQGGLVRKGREAEGKGTSNVGIFGGKDGKPAGDATNVVTDYAYLKGEARSPKAAFATQIALGFKEAFAKAKGEVKDASGATAEVKFDHAPAYPPFNLDKESPIVELRRQGGRIARAQTDLCVLEWRARCQLARQARHSDRHHRCGPIRDPHRERVCRPSGISRTAVAWRSLWRPNAPGTPNDAGSQFRGNRHGKHDVSDIAIIGLLIACIVVLFVTRQAAGCCGCDGDTARTLGDGLLSLQQALSWLRRSCRHLHCRAVRGERGPRAKRRHCLGRPIADRQAPARTAGRACCC